MDRAGGLEEFSKFGTVFHRLNIAIIELLELGTSGFDKQENDVISQELIWLEQALKRLRDLSPEIQENISVLNHRFGIFVDSTIPLVNTNVRQELSPEVQLIEKWLLELTKATDLLDISGDLLGIEDTNHILLLGHSSDELRGTGGFVSGIWIVDINGLERYEVTYFDVVKVDDMKKIEDYPSPPKLLEEHMGAWVFLMRDVSWSPDFREVAEASRTMINISQGIETDFVVGFNQQTLIDVLSEIDLHVNDEKQIKIINIGSKAALNGFPDAGAYLISKSSVHMLTRLIALENIEYNIRANAILPGVIDTKSNRDAMPKEDFSNWETPLQIAKMIERVIDSNDNGALVTLDN